jgi:integrase/recombinase XerD
MSQNHQPRRRAKTLTNSQLNQVLTHIERTSDTPLRDYAVILFSFRAGLRVGEIASLVWADVMDVSGMIRQDAFIVPNQAAKKGHGREIPMHPALYSVLVPLHNRSRPSPRDRIITGARYSATVSPNALQMYISRLFQQLGFVGASSHSGRRTFITTLAQQASNFGCSLKDVQKVAGHAYLDTTEGYIVDSPNVGVMVRSL